MEIVASNSITISDIMIGDVWLCSGQSNMELPMKRVEPIYGKEIAESNNPYIRSFEIPDRYDFNTPQDDINNGKWLKANPEKCT